MASEIGVSCVPKRMRVGLVFFLITRGSRHNSSRIVALVDKDKW